MSKALATKNVAAVLLAVAMVFGFAFSFAAPVKADAISDLQAQVQALLAQIQALSGSSSSSCAAFTFTTNFKKGQSGAEAMQIQKFLNQWADTRVSISGAGSPGNETSYFGAATFAAVVKFQNKYAADILTPVGLSKGTGNWFASTRAKANMIAAACVPGGNTGGNTGGTTGGSLVVSAATQPANSLAPAGAARVPFTSFTLRNTSNAAITVSGVVVQRTGLAADAAFAGVVLVDQNGQQIGIARTFDANHQATIGENMVIQPGASMTYTVSGNMAANLTAYSGQVAGISVVGINSNGTVSGSLPITGASQTINSTLAIGTVTAGISSFDPNAAQTKSIGDSAIKFSGIRLTAGSAEDVKLFSVRWRLNGSASASDVANVVTVVNGTSYPTTLSADGRYYTATFPGGILLMKGFSTDVYVQGDLVGSNAAGRVLEFDIDKLADVYVVGQTYGYGITISSSGSGSLSTAATHGTVLNTSNQPFLQGSTVTIQGGTVTSISNATEVASQNIAISVPSQVLGGFASNFTGEPVTVQTLVFDVATTSTACVVANGCLLQNVTLVDSNGAVVAGPVNATQGANKQVITFSNSVTFPIGRKVYTLKATIPAGEVSGQTYIVSTNPSSSSYFGTVTGQTTGNTVSLAGAGSFNMNTVTVRGGALAITASPNPASQTIVAGGQNILFANVQFDASQSGDDVRLSSFPLNASGTGSHSMLSACALWNGSTQLNTGSNTLNSVTPGSNTVTFNNPLIIPKGTVLTVGLTCNLSSSATTSSTFIFGVSGVPTATGVQSGNTITPTVTVGNSGTMTVAASASVTVSVDPSSPSYAVAAGGTSGVTLGVIKLRATNEALSLTKLGLTLTSGTASSLNQVYLYQGATLIGTATFTGANTTATSSLSTALTVSKDVDTLITVKGDLADIGTGQSGVEGALIKVDPLNFEGTGISSGATIRGGATAGVAGVRAFNTFPTLAAVTLPAGISDGRLMRFSVAADSHGNVGLYSFRFQISTTSVNVSNIGLYAYTDSGFNTAVSGQGTGGLIGTLANATTTGLIFSASTTANALQVPAGSTYYFELRGSVTGATTGASIVTILLGDSSFSGMLPAASVVGNFIWSPNATTTAALIDNDFTNGAGIIGLPSSGLITSRSN